MTPAHLLRIRFTNDQDDGPGWHRPKSYRVWGEDVICGDWIQLSPALLTLGTAIVLYKVFLGANEVVGFYGGA